MKPDIHAFIFIVKQTAKQKSLF